MGIRFSPSWNAYRRHYAQNQAYLDCFNENSVLGAINRAGAKSWYPRADAMLRAAFGVGGHNVDIEQGPHQPEAMEPFGGAGFALHVTARYQGYAYHLYMQQTQHGGLEVIEISG